MGNIRIRQSKIREAFLKPKDTKEIATIALDNIVEGILILSRDLKILWANKKIKDVTHLKESEIIGGYCYKVTHHREKPCQPPHDVCPIHELLETKKPVTILHTHFDKEGKEYYAEVGVYPIKDEKGNVVQFVHIARDVTNRVKAERALVKAKDYTDNIIKSIIDTLIVVDPDARIKTINKATSDLLGYTEAELIGKSVATIFAEEEEEEEEELLFKGTRLQKLIEEGSIRDYDMTYKTKSGEHIPVSFSGSVMYEKEADSAVEKGLNAIRHSLSAKIIGIVGIARDMREIKRLIQKEKELATAATAAAATDRKRAAELEKAYKELESAQEKLIHAEKLAAVGRLTAEIAHEINNPLTIIIGGTQLIMSRLSDKKTEFKLQLERVLRNARRCKTISSNLLGYGRTIDEKNEVINVCDLIREAIEAVGYQYDMSTIDVALNCKKRDNVKISVKRDALLSVFVNLIRNARQAIKERGRLTVTIKNKDTKWLCIKIHDTGIGMSKEQIAKLFHPFVTGWKEGEGIGLGLATSFKIIKTYGGNMVAESAGEGKGTTFTIILPCSLQEKKISGE